MLSINVYIGVTNYIHIAPGRPNVNVTSTTANSISLSWTVPNGSMVISYRVIWISRVCPSDIDEGNTRYTTTFRSTSSTIYGLRYGTNYVITVAATNSAGITSSIPVTARTRERCE